jgi:hypothetical protein
LAGCRPSRGVEYALGGPISGKANSRVWRRPSPTLTATRRDYLGKRSQGRRRSNNSSCHAATVITPVSASVATPRTTQSASPTAAPVEAGEEAGATLAGAAVAGAVAALTDETGVEGTAPGSIVSPVPESSSSPASCTRSLQTASGIAQ